MRNPNILFEIYIKGSFHVALMALCFYQINAFLWAMPNTFSQRLFVFSLVFVGYNGIRYYPFRLSPKSTPWLYWVLLPCTVPLLLFSLFHFIALSRASQLLIFLCFVLSSTYVIPLRAVLKNLRSFYGLKIFIVSCCWTLLTGLFPLLESSAWEGDKIIYLGLYFLLIFVAILPFEIRDLSRDAADLGTVPQQLGVRKTRWLGVLLLFFVLSSSYFILPFEPIEYIALMSMTVAYAILLFKVKPGDSENITLFWAEAVPVLGWAILYLNSNT